jgi:hypothetical protein
VTCGDKVSLLTENQSTYIPLGEVHRLENPGKVMLELIEVQSGSTWAKTISCALRIPTGVTESTVCIVVKRCCLATPLFIFWPVLMQRFRLQAAIFALVA